MIRAILHNQQGAHLGDHDADTMQDAICAALAEWNDPENISVRLYVGSPEDGFSDHPATADGAKPLAEL